MGSAFTDARATRAKPVNGRRIAVRATPICSEAIDGYSRLAYTEALDDEKAGTAAGFLKRAQAFFAAHGIHRISRLVTDNGSCYRAEEYAWKLTGVAKHQFIKPYTPKHNGKVERYNRILTEELLYAREYRSEEQRREATTV